VYDENLHPRCWYARTFDVPGAVRRGRVLLHLGAVDYRAKVWLNGQPLGEHEGGYDPLEFDVTSALRPESNRLVVRVEDDPNEDKPRGKQHEARYPSGCRYMRVTGIWQTVWLEGVGRTYLADWLLRADPTDGQLAVSVRLDGPGEDLRLVVEVSREGKPVAHGAVASHRGKAELTIRVPQVVAWSPERPALYDLVLRLQTDNGRTIDQVQTYAGFRKVETRNGRYFLNGKPFFLISALDQGYYPEGLYTPPSDEALRADVQWAKRFGLNSVRKHQIVAEPRYLYWCDRLGLTVWGEMADWGDSLKTDRFLRQWSACLKRDINHPSIITWVPTNERTAPHDERMNRIKVRLYEATRQLDPTRPVVDASGYCHARTDIVDLHVSPGAGTEWRDWWAQWHRTIDASGNMPLYADRPVMADGFRYAGQPVVISEMGLWRQKDFPPMSTLWRPYGGRIFATADQFLDYYRRSLQAMTADPACAGFSYVQLYDVEGEVNGYLTYDRHPKVQPEAVAAIHAQVLRGRNGE
jgi:beta-galactosidase/beta-glucuronidase